MTSEGKVVTAGKSPYDPMEKSVLLIFDPRLKRKLFAGGAAPTKIPGKARGAFANSDSRHRAYRNPLFRFPKRPTCPRALHMSHLSGFGEVVTRDKAPERADVTPRGRERQNSASRAPSSPPRELAGRLFRLIEKKTFRSPRDLMNGRSSLLAGHFLVC